MWGNSGQSDSYQNRSGNLESGTANPPAPLPPSSTSLAWDTRVQCFIGAFILSIVCSLCASYLLMLMKLSGFCIMTSIGSILSMIGTCFLTGPVSQIKSMFHKNRWLSSALYIFFIIMSIVAGLWLRNAPLAIICIVGEYMSMAWYSLSYIPYASTTIQLYRASKAVNEFVNEKKIRWTWPRAILCYERHFSPTTDVRKKVALLKEEVEAGNMEVIIENSVPIWKGQNPDGMV